MRSVIVRPATPEDFPEIIRIAEGLDGWFTADGIKEIRADLKYQPSIVAVDGASIAGFVTFTSYERKGRISWMGVQRDRHRSGIGRRLVEHVNVRMQADGIKELFVDTLGESVDYEPYARTRAFYRSLGFKTFQSIMQPGNEGMPERLVLVLHIPGPSTPSA